MINSCRVDGCGRPTELFACWRCVEWLGDDLDSVPELVSELEITAARQYGAERARGGESPLPYDPAASDALWVLANVTGTWAVHLARDRGVRATVAPGDAANVARIAVLAAGWLAGRLALLRMCPEVGTALDELRDAVRAARRAINREPAIAYAGTCLACTSPEHPAHMYARANDDGEPIGDRVTCALCGAEWSYQDTRAALERSAREQLGTAAEIARAVPVLYGIEVRVERVRQWGRRGRIEVRGHAANGRPLYRIGDVCELLERISLTGSTVACHAPNQGAGE